MAIPSTPRSFPMPIADSGDVRTIPELTPIGSNQLSFQSGFPPITSAPLTAGGIPPQREDFNAAMNLLSQHVFFTQSGCVYPWAGASESSPGLNYLRGAHVLGSDFQEYIAQKPSGPEIPAESGGFVGPVDPVGDASGVWMPVFITSTLERNGINRPDGTTITVDATGRLTASAKYELGEFYYFRHPTLKPGFKPAQGGVISNAATMYPEVWDYLQTTEGQMLCKTEAQWQAMTVATWATLADGSKIGWNGIGGAPFYVQDLAAGTLRMPDLRGMYAEAAGFDSLGVGDAQGDEIRDHGHVFAQGIAAGSSGGYGYTRGVSGNYTDVVKAVVGAPIGAATAPRRWGALASAFLGIPAS